MTAPYLATLTPYHDLATQIRITRTADDVVIHDRLHACGIVRAKSIMHDAIDRDMGIDTRPPVTLAEARERVSLIRRVSLVKHVSRETRKART